MTGSNGQFQTFTDMVRLNDDRIALPREKYCIGLLAISRAAKLGVIVREAKPTLGCRRGLYDTEKSTADLVLRPFHPRCPWLKE